MYAALSCSPTTVWLLHIRQDNLPGFAGCPPGTEPGGNWVQSSEYASLNQPNTPHLTPHSSLTHQLDAQGLKFNPFFGSPCHLADPFHSLTALCSVMTTNGSYDPGLDSASRPPRPTTPDRLVATVQCNPVDWQRTRVRRKMPENTKLLSCCRPQHTHSPSFLP